MYSSRQPKVVVLILVGLIGAPLGGNWGLAQPAAPAEAEPQPQTQQAEPPPAETPQQETQPSQPNPPVEAAPKETPEQSGDQPDAKPAEKSGESPEAMESPQHEAEPNKPAAPKDSDEDAPAGEPAESESAEPKPAESLPSESGEADSKPAERKLPPQPPVPWDEKMGELIAQRYPKSVEDLQRIQQQVQAVVQHCRPAVVAVLLGDSVGSGVIVDDEGLVLTAGHVAMEPHRKVVFLFPDGSRARGVTLGINRSIDSGMMRITDKGPWPHVKVAKSDALSTGDWVVGLGQPNGFLRDRAPPVRIGRVLYQDDEVINTDCTLVGGDSGGPLFNLKGEVVGIHSRIGSRITSNFHVPISTYELTWKQLLAGQIWGGGITGDEPARYRPMLGLAGNPRETPCRITQVFPGMPAHRSGIKPGDIILRFEDHEIKSFAELSQLVLAQKAGEQVSLAIEREGKPRVIRVRLGMVARNFPGAPPLPEGSPAPSPNELDD